MEVPSPRRRLRPDDSRDLPDSENTATDTNGVVDQDGDGDNQAKEERLKVVVRVRPLQKKEEPWNCADADDSLTTDNGSVSNRKKQPATNTVDPMNSVAAAPSTLRIHDSSVTWEKNGQTKMLLADAVFDGNAQQQEVFDSVQECVDGLIAGFDCSVFAYGQTGTGKTHTMSGLPNKGDDADLDDDDDSDSSTINESYGVVPRAIHKLFDQIDHALDSGTSETFDVYCSFVEIYNEKIYDILSSDTMVGGSTPLSQRIKGPTIDTRAGWNRPQPTKEAPSLQIRQKLDGSVFVDGLTSRKISTRSEMLRAFREGSLNREVRDNLYNQHSSRGHTVFQITLRKTLPSSADKDTQTNTRSPRTKSPSRRPPSTNSSQASTSRLSRLYFVDLAGSEKWHVLGSELTDKYATELSSINKSLSALTSCVLALTQKERTHVPYRDSVLTRLLQSCLQGHGRTAFIVTISPARDSMEESFATLRFAERLKTLKCKPVRRHIVPQEVLAGEQRVYYEKQIQSMRQEVTRLRELLKKARRRNQEIADNAAAAANVALVEENRRLKELLKNAERDRDGERVYAKAGKPSVTSPQRIAATHILTSGTTPRPFSEEDPPSKQLAGTEVMDGTPSTPPPRQHVQPHGDAVDDHLSAVSATTGSVSDEKEYSSLVNRLQDKEARLNWILEAEMEAQNTRTRSRPVIQQADDAVSSSENATPLSPKKPSSTTRSWAVERALQRQLVTVPSPVRVSASLSSDQTENHRHHQMTEDSGIDSKVDSPRRPTRPVDRSPAPQSSHHQHQPVKLPPAAPTQQRQPAQSSTRTPRAPPASTNADDAPTVKSASILKLVGTSTADKMGKSKDELVDEYKRARRAELEAMLRTMVHR